jgi:CheY-like chemotaxis protein
VILSDISVPGMVGLALLREIKSRLPKSPRRRATAPADELGAAEFLTNSTT